MTTLKVLSAGAIRRSVAKVARVFERETGSTVSIEFAPGPKVRDRLLAGEVADVAIASSGALDKLAAAGRIAIATRTSVGRTGMGVMVRKGPQAPALSSTAAFRQALLEADTVVYNSGSSGTHAAAVLDRLGVRGELGTRLRVVDLGADLIELVATSPQRVLGLVQLTNIFDQMESGVTVQLAGAFPGEIQNVTAYETAVVTGSANQDAAGAFVRTFTMAEIRKLLTAAGLD